MARLTQRLVDQLTVQTSDVFVWETEVVRRAQTPRPGEPARPGSEA